MSVPSSERAAVRATVRALVAAGWQLYQVYDGGGEYVKVRNETEAMAAIEAVDESYLIVRRASEGPGGERGWVRFIFQGGQDAAPDEVINDYTTNLACVDELTATWY